MKPSKSLLRNRACTAIAAALAVTIVTSTGAAGMQDKAISIVDVDNLQWRDYPGLPGVKFVVIAGDPSQPGIRIRFQSNEI